MSSSPRLVINSRVSLTGELERDESLSDDRWTELYVGLPLVAVPDPWNFGGLVPRSLNMVSLNILLSLLDFLPYKNKSASLESPNQSKSINVFAIQIS